MLIAQDIASALDPVALAARCEVTPDPWQAQFLRSTSRRVLQLAARQVGKTTSTALKALHVAQYEPEALVIIVAPAERQSKEFVRTLIGLHRRLDGGVEMDAESVTKVEFRNGARVMAMPGGDEGKTVRGFANARLVVIDEAAQVSDELLAAITPMLATNPRGELIALTTPKGRRGWFYDLWHDNDPNWERVKVTVDQCPRIRPEFLEEQRRMLGPTRFAEEYELAFVDSDTAAFPTAVIDAAFDPEVRPLW